MSFLNDDYGYKYANIWAICCNCEYQISVEDYFFEIEDNILDNFKIECPCCESKEIRIEEEQ